MHLFKFSIKPNSIQWLLSELVIIILGILIAFQVEEWRDYQNDREAEVALLQAFHIDLTKRMHVMDIYTSVKKQNIEAIETITELFRTKPEVTYTELIPHLEAAFRNYLINDSKARSMGMLESAKLDLILNKTLRMQLIDHYNSTENYYLELTYLYREQEELIEASIYKAYRNIPIGNLSESKEIQKVAITDLISEEEKLKITDQLLTLYESQQFLISRHEHFLEVTDSQHSSLIELKANLTSELASHSIFVDDEKKI